MRVGLRNRPLPLKSTLQRPSYPGRRQGSSVRENNYLFNSEKVRKHYSLELDMGI